MEARVEKDDALADLDARLKEEHLNILTRCEISKWNQTITNPIFLLDCRFYQCFESIQLYGVSLVQLVDDLEGGRLVGAGAPEIGHRDLLRVKKKKK